MGEIRGMAEEREKWGKSTRERRMESRIGMRKRTHGDY